jgi:hypothetical protein
MSVRSGVRSLMSRLRILRLLGVSAVGMAASGCAARVAVAAAGSDAPGLLVKCRPGIGSDARAAVHRAHHGQAKGTLRAMGWTWLELSRVRRWMLRSCDRHPLAESPANFAVGVSDTGIDAGHEDLARGHVRTYVGE